MAERRTKKKKKDIFEAGAVFGRYTIVRRIGRGGMGAVYEATHNELKKRVAIKALDPKLADDPELTVRFLREGESAARIQHPNVVDIYDVGVEGEITYLVMELLDGEDLGDLLKRMGPLSPQSAADIMLPVCAALSAAHEESVVHRDLKPGNIFIARDVHGTVRPKVLDFGISKIIDNPMDGLTTTGAILGTPYYMSPEQAHGGKTLDHRSDVYSLGVILYQCITGSRPFVADSMYQVLHKIVAGEFERPTVLKGDLDPSFEAVVMKSMGSKPEDRFQTVTELGAAILPFASPRQRAVWAPLFDKGAVAEWETQPPMKREAAYSEPISQSSLSQSAAPQTINHTGSSMDIHPPDRRRAMMIGGVVLCVLAAFVLFLAMPGGDDEVVAVPIEPKANVEPTPPPAKTIVETYTVKINATPAAAKIFIDGDEVATGSYDGTMLKDGRTHELVVRADGHVAYQTVFTDAAPPSDVKLNRVRRKAPVRTSPPPKRIVKKKPVVKKKQPKKGANDALILR